jgi:hypothetical protein
VGSSSQCPTSRSAIEKVISARPKTSIIAGRVSPPSTSTLWNSTQISANSTAVIRPAEIRSKVNEAR